MQTISKSLAAIVLVGLCSVTHASDMRGAVTYSLGEFDRVGVSHAVPKATPAKPTNTPDTKLAATSQTREMNMQKAEFVRRMFWMALSMR